jgi:hypothetical protein
VYIFVLLNLVDILYIAAREINPRLNLMLLSTHGDRPMSRRLIRLQALHRLKLSRLVVFRGLVSRQDVFLLIDVAEGEVL